MASKTLRAWANNAITRFDAPVMDALCQYFDIQPGRLFEYVPDDQDQEKSPAAFADQQLR